MRRSPEWRRGVQALSMGVVIAATVTACSAADAGSTDAASDWSAWTQRMQTVLQDPSGQGSLAGRAPGGGDLGSVRQGDYRLVAACSGVDVVHVTARADGKLLGETDVPCGATVEIPITYRGGGGLELRATVHGKAGSGAWYVGVNGASWTPSGSYGFG